MTGRTQEELVGMLRSTKQGETVSVLVSRQEEMFLPRELVMERENKRACPRTAALTDHAASWVCFTLPLLLCLIFICFSLFSSVSSTLCLFPYVLPKEPLSAVLCHTLTQSNPPGARSGLPVPLLVCWHSDGKGSHAGTARHVCRKRLSLVFGMLADSLPVVAEGVQGQLQDCENDTACLCLTGDL